MNSLELDNLVKQFAQTRAVDEVSLSVPAGTFVCLLGPSGCGKTTLLRMIAGLEQPDSGTLSIDGKDITHVATHKRNIGMVFQSLALFPHLSVGENIAYPMRIRNRRAAECKQRVVELLELVHLPGFSERKVSQLSGGQRQRVAIARALTVSPTLFLLDEPLSALDANLREAMQIELRQLQQQLGITTIVVTHDQREAMTMADQIVVMGEGRVQQVAAPTELYRKPVNAFVANFIGSTNLLPVTSDAGVQRVFGRCLAELVGAAASSQRDEQAQVLSIRPEDLELCAPGSGHFDGTVSFVRDLGATVETFIEVEGNTLTAVSTSRRSWQSTLKERVGVSFAVEDTVLLAS